MSNLGTVFAQYEEVHRRRVEFSTFGHLAPTPGVVYTGWMAFTWAGYGGHIIVINAEWKDLDDSPWLVEDMQDHVGKLIEQEKIERGEIYKFAGTYLKLKNWNYRFKGKMCRIPIERHLVGM
jgi:hypothetical protein